MFVCSYFHCSRLFNWALTGFWSNQQHLTFLFALFCALNHALTWLLLLWVMISWRKSWHHPFSYCFRSSDSHVFSSGLHDICTVLISKLSYTFILMSLVHVACFSCHLKFGIAWCKNFILSCRLESFLIFCNKYAHKLYQCFFFRQLSGLFDHILGLILP